MDPSIRALMDDSLDAWLAEDWTASQGDELMPTEDDDLLIAACRIEEEKRIREQVSKAVERVLKHRDVIKIKKADYLSCARALVAIKAYVDKVRLYEPEYHTSKLYRDAGVPEVPCRNEELLEQFQAFLGPQGYQIKVFERKGGVLWFCDNKYEDAPKKLCLLKEGEHFHGLRRTHRIVHFLQLFPNPDDIRYGSPGY